MLEKENIKQVYTSIGGPFKKKEVIRSENYKYVRTSTEEALKKKEMFRDKKVKWICTYADRVSTGKLSKERER